MFWSQPSVTQWLRATFSLTLAFILLIGYPSQALAGNDTFWNAVEQKIESFLGIEEASLDPPTGRGKSGAGRGQCSVLASLNQLPLIALVRTRPSSQNTEQLLQKISSSEIVWGRTVEAYPTFWFYIPYSLNEQSELKFAKFVLLNKEKHVVGRPVYVKLPVTGKPSIAGFTLTDIKLESEKEYKWFFSLLCDSGKPSRNPSVTGWIKRVSLTPTPRGYQEYGLQGIWYDLVTRIVESHMATPQVQGETTSLNTIWSELFQFLVQNNEIANENRDAIARKLAEAPISKLVPVSEGEVLSQ